MLRIQVRDADVLLIPSTGATKPLHQHMHLHITKTRKIRISPVICGHVSWNHCLQQIQDQDIQHIAWKVRTGHIMNGASSHLHIVRNNMHAKHCMLPSYMQALAKAAVFEPCGRHARRQ